MVTRSVHPQEGTPRLLDRVAWALWVFLVACVVWTVVNVALFRTGVVAGTWMEGWGILFLQLAGLPFCFLTAVIAAVKLRRR